VARAVVAGDPGPVEHERDGQAVQRDVHERLVEGAVQEGRVQADDRVHAAHGEARGAGDGVLLGDADVVGAVGVRLAEGEQPHRLQHGGGDGDDVGTVGADGDHLLAEDARPAACAGGDRLAGHRVGHGGDAVQAVGLVVDGRLVAVALDGDGVDDDRSAEGLGPAQRGLHGGGVVAVHRPEVLHAEVLEQHLRLQEVLDPALEPVQRRVDRRADDGGARQRRLDGVEGPLVRLRHPQRRQVVGEAADRRGVGPAVVVDHDDDRQVAGGDVVQRLPAHAAGERAVADDRDDVAVLAAQPVGLGQAVGVRQRRRGVACSRPGRARTPRGSGSPTGRPACAASRTPRGGGP
jgi:hypothetical protein